MRLQALPDKLKTVKRFGGRGDQLRNSTEGGWLINNGPVGLLSIYLWQAAQISVNHRVWQRCQVGRPRAPGIHIFFKF